MVVVCDVDASCCITVGEGTIVEDVCDVDDVFVCGIGVADG